MTIPSSRIAQIEARHAELQHAMSAPDLAAEQFVALSREDAEPAP